MDHYLVSARKYRPATFDTVVGQKALTATLKNAIATNRLAHSYLFCGSRGVGKTSCARIFAKTINCEHVSPDGEACNQCDSCRAFNAGNSLNIIEMDAASNNGVDDMRALVEQVMIPPSSGRYRVFIIDEVHMLSNAAFNAFLKTLEEPPEYVIFILATTEKHKIIPTILSRCQIYDFNTIRITDMVDHLTYVASQEGITVETSALGVIARKADGAMRDALSIFDQVAASTRGNITYKATIENLNVLDASFYERLTRACLEGRTLDTWLIYKEIRDHGFDSHFFVNGFADYLRDVMVARDPSTASLLDADPEAAVALAAMGQDCPPPFIYRAMDLLNTADLNWRTAANKQLLVELTLAKISQLVNPLPASTSEQAPKLNPVGQSQNPTQHSNPQQTLPDSEPQSAAKTQPSVSSSPRQSYQPSMPSSSRREPSASAPSLRSIKKNAEPTTNAKDTVTTRDNEFTQEEFLKAFDDFRKDNASRKILVNILRNSQPLNVEAKRYIIKVDEKQNELIQDDLLTLNTYLRDKLGNSQIVVDTVIEEVNLSRFSMTDQQLVEAMMKENPQLGEALRSFNVTVE